MKITKFLQKNNLLIFFIILITITPMIIETQTRTVQAKIQWDEQTQGMIAEHAIFSLPSPWMEFFMDFSDFLYLHAEGPD